MKDAPVSTPCTKVCAVSGRTGMCIGCGRTLREIAAWSDYDERQRRAIMDQLPARLASAKAQAKAQGPAE
jgi:uncharacterized protein